MAHISWRTIAFSMGMAAAAVVGCGNPKASPQDPPPEEGATSFISYLPGGGRSVNEGADGGLTGGPSGAPSEDSGSDGDGGEAERAIAEADIIKVEGTKLYALSRFSGLSIVDVSDPAHLALLGGYKTSAVPFEMYVEGQRVYVMYQGWGRYEYDAELAYYTWHTTGRVQALDVSNPASIAVLGDHDVPGYLSDSRKVGDVLYLVSYEDGYCWNCDKASNTRVTSFNVADPDEFQLIDELRLVDTGGYGGRRSISVTPERIYVSGRDWSGTEAGVIDVIDISDPAGDLVQGAELPIAGPIDNRWQIDEFDGTLRVISQPGGWGTTTSPVVETFSVASASNIEPLASLSVVLPRPESLRSVRFDGVRAYAITFERTDPLFTFDLSDPAQPKQLGELEIPGWVYHMEPRGDRIYALGFEDGNEGGALHVSIFDVSDLDSPTQLARVNFGGTWANLAEDQDRIHKAFNILSEEGLILVPFSGWDYDKTDTECGYGTYQSGIQLIDATTNDLTLRGVAPAVGEARRGFLVNGTLFGVSDNAVQTFDIADRDAPASLGRLELARNVSQIRVMGSTMLRFGSDWWTNQTTLDFARLDRVDQAEPLGEIDLSSYDVDDTCNHSSNWENQVLVQGAYAYVPRRTSSWNEGPDGKGQSETLTFFIVDLHERTAPRLHGTFEIKTTNPDEYLSSVIKTDSALLVGRVKSRSYQVGTEYRTENTFTYDVVSLADPEAPVVVSQLTLPTDISSGGYGYPLVGCAIDVGWGWWRGGYGSQQALVSGDVVASQHQVPLGDGTGRARYYLDRIDVSDPAHPVLLPAVNIPGSVVSYDHESGRVVTVEYRLATKPADSWEECRSGSFDDQSDLCTSYPRSLNTLEVSSDVATLLDTELLDRDSDYPGELAVTESRVFTLAYDYETGSQRTVTVYALSDDAKIDELARVALHDPGWGTLVARGDRAFISSQGVFSVLDATDESDVHVTSHDMAGYYCGALEVAGDVAYCALGYQGVQAFSLE